MSPESEANAPASEGQDAEHDEQRRASDAPSPRLVPREKASGRLSEERETTGQPSLGLVCSFIVVASAAAFVACGLWQVGALISHAHEVVAAHAAAPSNPSPHARPAPATGAVSLAPALVPSPRAAVTSPPQVRPEKSPAASADPVLTAAANMATAGATAATFEGQAEASERAVPVGLEPALDGASSDLPLGYPPPAEYPRASCKEIFVYIVTVAEGSPERSAASIGVGKKGPARFRRPGERIGEWTVLAISDDWTGLNPDVWLEKDGTVCRAELEGNSSRIHQAPKPRTRPKARRRRR